MNYKEKVPSPESLSKFEEVYEIVKLIPYGRVCTYGAISEYLWSKRAARLVGWALNASHCREDVPAHRVVNRNGLLSGKHHFETSDTMQSRLETEGIVVENNQIKNFNTYFWNPTDELL